MDGDGPNRLALIRLYPPYDVKPLIRRIAARYLAKTAAIKVEEIGTELVVSGSYDEMKGILSKIKSRGFYYNGSDRTWRIPLSKMTPAKRKNLDKLLGVLTPAQKAKKEQEDKAREQEVIVAAKTLAGHKYPGLPVTLNMLSLYVKGSTYPIKDKLYKLGGRWENNTAAYVFPVLKMTMDQLDDLHKVLEVRGKVNGDRFEAVKKLLGSDHKLNWPTLGITLSYTLKEGFAIKGGTKPYAGKIRSLFEHPQWTGYHWSVKGMTEGPDPFEKLIDIFDGDEKEEATKPPPAPAEPKCRPNRKPGYCRRCGQPVAVGDGCIYQAIDYENDRNVWEVVHEDKRVCEENIKRKKEEMDLERERHLLKSTAYKNIMGWVKSHGTAPSGHHKIPGELTYIKDRRSVIYGGGEWVVTEPDGKHFWYVRNNGADGDDWSRNNVQTGGAGAIGVRAPLTPEVGAWIEAASKGED